jgi:hypothetical protein
VKNKGKLSQSLNSVWVGDFRVWEKVTRFDRIAHNDVDVVKSNTVLRKEGMEDAAVVSRRGDGVIHDMKGDSVVVKRGVEGMVTIGSMVVLVGGFERKKRVKRLEEAIKGL